jgi:hypothetical protein
MVTLLIYCIFDHFACRRKSMMQTRVVGRWFILVKQKGALAFASNMIWVQSQIPDLAYSCISQLLQIK